MTDTYRDQLQRKIDYHEAESARLKHWRDGLDSYGFDWRQATIEDQWRVDNLKFGG